MISAPYGCAVAVLRYAGQYCLVAQADVSAGELLFVIDGKLTDVASSHSVQVEESLHVDLPEGFQHDEIMDRFFWRYMNHSCEPTARICGRDVISMTSLSAGDEITFDYCTTEYDMAEPFACRCGSRDCARQIRGYRYLPAARKELLMPWLAPHIVRLAARPTQDQGAGRLQ